MNEKAPGADRLVISPGMADILKTSCKLMANRGFHGTSMRGLAQATGRSISGLYHHFRSKEDLLFLINYHGFATLNDSWAQLKEAFDAPHKKLYAFVYFHTFYFVEHMDEMKVMTWGTHAMNLEKARIVQSLKNRYTDSARKIVRDVCEANGKSVNPERLERLTFLLFGMMNWIFSWYSRRRHGDVSELARDIYRTATSGLGARPAGVEDLVATEAVVRDWFRDSEEPSMWAFRDRRNPKGGASS